MSEVLGEGPSFEHYDDTEVENLINQGWEMDADGLDEDEAYEMSQYMTQEHRIFVKEDGTCTILVRQMSAVDEMGGNEYGQNPKEVQYDMHNEYYDRLPEVMGDNNNQK